MVVVKNSTCWIGLSVGCFELNHWTFLPSPVTFPQVGEEVGSAIFGGGVLHKINCKKMAKGLTISPRAGFLIPQLADYMFPQLGQSGPVKDQNFV